MANATVAGLGSFLADVMIETTTNTIHARRLRRTRHRIAATKPCGSPRRGRVLKERVCTPICRSDSDRSPSRPALMPLGAGVSERCARDRSPPGPRRREAARFTRARRAGSPARAPSLYMRRLRRVGAESRLSLHPSIPGLHFPVQCNAPLGHRVRTRVRY
jgi:hypothetical protein